VSTSLIPLAVLMAAVTYPSRALALLVPGVQRLPGWTLTYLRLVGPAVLAGLAAVTVGITTEDAGRPELHIGPEWLAVLLCVAVVAWRRNLLLGLLLAAGFMAALRAVGLALV
jgi:branched-subunit amino acid transport protein